MKLQQSMCMLVLTSPTSSSGTSSVPSELLASVSASPAWAAKLSKLKSSKRPDCPCCSTAQHPQFWDFKLLLPGLSNTLIALIVMVIKQEPNQARLASQQSSFWHGALKPHPPEVVIKPGQPTWSSLISPPLLWTNRSCFVG